LPVKVDFGMAATGGELEPVVWAPLAQPLRDDIGVGFEDHSQVGSVSFGVHMPEEGRVDAIETLHNQAGWDVAVRDDRPASFGGRSDFRLHMMVAVSRV